MDLDPDFRKIRDVPEGLRLSARIQDPLLVIDRVSSRITLRLCAKLMSGGQSRIVEAPSLGHNWVLDRSIIRPLPVDISEVIEPVVCGLDVDGLTLPQVLRVQRASMGIISIEIRDPVFQTANEGAKQSGEIAEIPNLKATLYSYQKEGVSWMRKTLLHTSGVILADEMGLGKTIQVISLFLLDPPRNDFPALIVCPTTLIANWHRELGKFAPSLSILIHRGSDRTGVYRGLMRAQVVIATYDTVVNDIAIFSAFQWSFVVCDEAQAIKNPSSKRRQALAAIPRARSIPVTGTPVENSLTDLWSLCDFAIPGLLGTQVEFESAYSDQISDAQAVSRITNPIVLKRRVADVAGDLPSRIDVDMPLELSPHLAQQYEKIRTETIAKYPTAGALVATGQLALFCAHPLLQSEDFESPDWEERVSLIGGCSDDLVTPKIEQAVSLVREAFSLGRKVLVFSNYNACGPILREAIDYPAQFYWDAINGSTPQRDRQAIVDEFSNYEGPGALVLNPKAAGAGLNITAATVVIHFTQCWNPALEMQASARAHRRGQTEPVTIYRLFYENTVEEVMVARSQWKRALSDNSVPISSRDGEDFAHALSFSPIGKL
ncbi:DEAD/DEAH box helicase [Actomonas aquatica]|uniref:DEAD/DEAH box helicase n=1 Tax=Actomonas aquatica TaxID=2866162 RepID=A0ABZ1C6K0_9BACT|nr:DEAD/DEAH box helicase [Opitutus sp. WL0086]WRQ87265.1 DEAD/DEAH box helicase [Opitutus sp. WL0086]